MEVDATSEIQKENEIEDEIETEIDLVLLGWIPILHRPEVALEEGDMTDHHPSSLEATVYHSAEEVVEGTIHGLMVEIEVETDTVVAD